MNTKTKQKLQHNPSAKPSLFEGGIIPMALLALATTTCMAVNAQSTYPGRYGIQNLGNRATNAYNREKRRDTHDRNSQTNRQDERHETFEGNWTGQWSNSCGQKGSDTLNLSRTSDGQLTGIWTGEVNVLGRQISENTIELSGRTYNRDYRATARLNNGILSMKYTALRLDEEGGSYSGKATFTRQYQPVLGEAEGRNVNIVMAKSVAAKVIPGAENTDLTAPVINRLNETLSGSSTAKGNAPVAKVEAPNLKTDIDVLTQRIEQEPQNAELYLSRSIYYLAQGSASSSGDDAKKALDLVSEKSSNPKDEYRKQMSIILRCLSFEKNKDKTAEDALLNLAKVRCTKTQWPYPLIRYFSGELNEASIVARSVDAQMEERIIVGFRKLIQGKNSEAVANFRAAQKLPYPQSSSLVNYKKIAASMLAILSG